MAAGVCDTKEEQNADVSSESDTSDEAGDAASCFAQGITPEVPLSPGKEEKEDGCQGEPEATDASTMAYPTLPSGAIIHPTPELDCRGANTAKEEDAAASLGSNQEVIQPIAKSFIQPPSTDFIQPTATDAAEEQKIHAGIAVERERCRKGS